MPVGDGPGLMSSLAPINSRILEEAADWLVQLNDGNATDQDRAACARWQEASEEHARAWARAELLTNKLGSLPSGVALPLLDKRQGSAGRRAAVVRLAALLAVVPAGLAAWRLAGSQEWSADHHTATGERRELQLADGSRVTLNTGSAIDVRFDSGQRLIVLHHGEIFVQTASDTSASHRPLRVMTSQGRLEALGTRFNVSERGQRVVVAVLEGAVRVEPRLSDAAGYSVVNAGQQAVFSKDMAAPATEVDSAATAWTQGMLLADRMRLADFAQDMARYRSGLVQCDPAVADLRISGAFPVDDTDRALAMLVSTYRVDALSRLGGYWVTLVPR